MTISQEIQKLLIDTLRGDTALTALVNGVWDQRPVDEEAFADPKLSCVTLGATDVVDDFAECIEGETHTVQIDVWSRSVGTVGCKAIVDTLKRILNRAELGIATNALVEVNVPLARVFRDPDGMTSHGVVSVEFMVEVT